MIHFSFNSSSEQWPSERAHFLKVGENNRQLFFLLGFTRPPPPPLSPAVSLKGFLRIIFELLRRDDDCCCCWMDWMQWRSISFLNSKRTSSRLELTVQFAPVPFLLLLTPLLWPSAAGNTIQFTLLFTRIHLYSRAHCIQLLWPPRGSRADLSGALLSVQQQYPLGRRLLAAAHVMDFYYYYYYLSVSVHIWIFYFILWMDENVWIASS